MFTLPLHPNTQKLRCGAAAEQKQLQRLHSLLGCKSVGFRIWALDPENADSRFLQNAGMWLPNYTLLPLTLRVQLPPKRRHLCTNYTCHIPQDHSIHIQCTTDFGSHKRKVPFSRQPLNIDSTRMPRTIGSPILPLLTFVTNTSYVSL